MKITFHILAVSLMAIGLTFVTSPVLAAEYNVGDPCPAGFPDGMKHQKDDGSGNAITLVCDGGNFVLNEEVTGTKTLLQINNDPNTCTAAKEGRLRYDPSGDAWAYCDSGGNWTPLFGSNCVDDAVGECVLLTSRATSDPEFTAANIADGVNILGVTGSLAVPANCSDDGTGNCVLDATRSNSDPEFTAANIASGVNILGVTGTLTGGGGCTAPSDCTNIGDSCSTNGGALGGYVTYGNTCEPIFYTIDSSVVEFSTLSVETGAQHPVDGQANHDWIVANTSLSNYPAFQVCENLTTDGKTDWYLPSITELNIIYDGMLNGSIPYDIGTFAVSSTEVASDPTKAYYRGMTNRDHFMFGDAFASIEVTNKSNTTSTEIYCIRRN